MSDSESDSDLKGKFSEEESYSDKEKCKEAKSVQNAEKNKNTKMEIKESPKEEKKAIKEKNSSSEDVSSEERQREKKEKEKEFKKEDKKEEEKEDKKEKKEDVKNKKASKNKLNSSSESSSTDEEEKKRRRLKAEENKKKKEEERKEKLRKVLEEKEKKEKEDELKKEEESKKRKEKIEEEKQNNSRKNQEEHKNNERVINNKNEIPPWRNNNNVRNNFNNNSQQNSYIKRKVKKYDLNNERLLNDIISQNTEIIEEMKNAYPRIPKLDCANIIKKLKVNTSSLTLFEIMNMIHRNISTELTLNRANEDEKKNLSQIEPYEIIDTIYNNPEHVNIMKYYKIYSHEDKEKLPPYLQESLPNYYYYNKNREKEERRRKVIKYIDGSFNYIPLKCNNNCNDNNCPYSHNDNENDYHPLYYKTMLMNNLGSNIENKLNKNSYDLFKDFRIIYNYKNENIINLMKLIEEKKFSKFSFREYMKTKISSFSLNTFKTLECPSIKSGIKCPKEDPHLCYYFHEISERRRPPSLYRYINEMCPNQIIKNGRLKEKCKYGDFCNKCHSRYEYYYHALFYGRAMTCKRPKKFGKCIFEETCYAYHPYKEPGYKRTKEEIMKEKKDELLQKYDEENKSLGSLIEKFRCPNCTKYKSKLKYCLLLNCEHIICANCFEKNNRCPKCKKKYKNEKEGEDFILLDITNSSNEIDALMKKNYEKKKELEKNVEKEKEMQEKKEEIKEEQNKNIKDKHQNEENENDKDCNTSM